MAQAKKTPVTLDTIASLLELQVDELKDLLEKEHRIIQGDPDEKRRYFPAFRQFLQFALDKIEEIHAGEKYFQVLKRLIHRDERRRFYFFNNELEAVARILDYIDHDGQLTLQLIDLDLFTLPSVLGRARGLKTLDISKNKLKNIYAVTQLNELEVLIADDNNITDISYLSANQKLQVLSLNRNGVKRKYDVFKLMPLLRQVSLNANRITDEEVRPILESPYIQTIQLLDNPINVPLKLLTDVNGLRSHLNIHVPALPDEPLQPEQQNVVDETDNAETSGQDTTASSIPEPNHEPTSEPPTTQTVNEPKEEQYISYAIRDIRLRGNPDKTLLDVEKLSGIFYSLITNSDSNGEHFFGLFGRWGRGKTFFWKYILKNNLDREKYFPIEFHAWKYQDTPGIWAYLYNTLNDAYLGDKPKWYQLGKWFQYYWKILVLNGKRGKLPILFTFLITLVIAVIAYYYNDFKGDETAKTILRVGIPVSAISMVIYIAKTFKTDARKIISSLTSNVNFNSQLGFQHEIQQELKYLLQAWISEKQQSKKRIFLFIDDIDRCSEDKIIQIVDYIRVLLHCEAIQDRITVLAAIDERILLHAIQDKYKAFIENKDNDATYKELCREYMDKLFLAGLKLGPLTEFEKRQIVEGFTSVDTAPADVATSRVANGINADKVADIISQTENEGEPVKNKQEAVSASGEIKVVIPENGQLAEVPVNKDGSAQPEPAPIPVKSSHIASTAPKEFPYEKWEQDFIKDILARNTESTPRSIRVYTYRYLLGKQLVEKALTEGKISWAQWYNTKEAKQCFAIKLLHYGFKADTDHLLSDYRNFISDYDESRSVKESIYGYEISLNQELGSIMFQVLTMIIAY